MWHGIVLYRIHSTDLLIFYLFAILLILKDFDWIL
jgi:hypothetical protein